MFVASGNAILIEFEESLNKFKEKKLVVVDKGGESFLGLYFGVVGVSFVGNFVAQVGDDLVESLKVADVFAHDLLGKGVCFFADEGV